MFAVHRLAVVVLFGAAALVTPVAASAGPRAPTTPLSSHSFLVNGLVNLAARANGCPVGWAVCSSFSCYPLDGSECCSDGAFCEVGEVCLAGGGCCPIGEICGGVAPPPITIGGGNTPTDTDTFLPPPPPTTTHRAPTSTARPTKTDVTPTPTDTFEPTSDDPLGITAFSVTPHASVTVTTPSSFLAGGTEPGEGLLPTSSGAPQFPFSGGNSGAAKMAKGVPMAMVLAAVLAVLMSIV